MRAVVSSQSAPTLLDVLLRDRVGVRVRVKVGVNQRVKGRV